MTDRTDHVAEAQKCEDSAIASRHANDPDGGLMWATLAQAHYTAALVEQQRIANLIALSGIKLEMPGGGESTFIYAFDVDWVDVGDVRMPNFTLRPDIAAALGMKP